MPVLVLVSHRLAGPQRQLATETETGPSEKKQKNLSSSWRRSHRHLLFLLVKVHQGTCYTTKSTKNTFPGQRLQLSRPVLLNWRAPLWLVAHGASPFSQVPLFFSMFTLRFIFRVIPIPHSTLRHTFQLFWSVCLFWNPQNKWPTVLFIHSSLFAFRISNL